LIAKASLIFGTNPYNVLRTKNLLLFAKSFMEKDALDPDRIRQCCYAITGVKGVFSFSALIIDTKLAYFPSNRCWISVPAHFLSFLRTPSW